MTKLTTRKPLKGMNVSHAHNRTKKTQNLNLQSRKVDGKKVELTTSYLFF